MFWSNPALAATSANGASEGIISGSVGGSAECSNRNGSFVTSSTLPLDPFVPRFTVGDYLSDWSIRRHYFGICRRVRCVVREMEDL